MKTTIPLFLILLCVAQACLSPLHGATILSLPLDVNGDFQDPGGVSFDQLRSGFAPDEGTTERDVKDNRDNAQTFKLTSAQTIDKIAINFQQSLLDDSEATFSFFSVADPTAEVLTPITVFDTVTFTAADLLYSAGTLIIDVADTFAAADSSFGIMFDSAASEPLVFKWTFTPSEYPDAMRYEKGLDQVNDFYTVGVIPVPEPGAPLLLALAGLALLTRRKSRIAR